MWASGFIIIIIWHHFLHIKESRSKLRQGGPWVIDCGTEWWRRHTIGSQRQHGFFEVVRIEGLRGDGAMAVSGGLPQSVPFASHVVAMWRSRHLPRHHYSSSTWFCGGGSLRITSVSSLYHFDSLDHIISQFSSSEASRFDHICGDFEMHRTDRQTDRHASFPSAYLCLLHFWVNTSVVKIDALCLANLYLSLNFRSFGSFGFRTVWNSGRRMARFLEIFGFKAVRVSGGIVTRDLG